MKTIWKFPFEIGNVIEIEMPVGAIVLHVDIQKQITNQEYAVIAGISTGASVEQEVLCVWALVNPEANKEIRKFRLFGTGHPFPEDEDLIHVGSFQMEQGKLVFHLFE